MGKLFLIGMCLLALYLNIRRLLLRLRRICLLIWISLRFGPYQGTEQFYFAGDRQARGAAMVIDGGD